jgi:hypothetical protein
MLHKMRKELDDSWMHVESTLLIGTILFLVIGVILVPIGSSIIYLVYKLSTFFLGLSDFGIDTFL